MRVNFRQGIVKHQTGTFLSVNGNGHVDLLAANKPVTFNIAHKTKNYTHSEDNTVNNAWLGPFSAPDYWLYVDFNPLTFVRTFGRTLLEPVAQSAMPGAGNAAITAVTAGNAGVGSFTVSGKYVLDVDRTFDVVGSTANDGTYTIASVTFSGISGNTIITTDEVITDSTVDGELTIDVDSSGIPLVVDGRHWYNTATNKHYVRNGSYWSEVLRIFVAQLHNGATFISQSINAPLYTGSQIGDVSSILSGRVLFDETMEPQLRDDGTFLTTEDQFFTNQSRVDGIRLESNVSKAQNVSAPIAAFAVVAYTGDGRIESAVYADTGETVLGLLTESLATGEVGSVIIQGVVTNPDWDWLTYTDVGQQLWVDNGMLVFVDPHVSFPVTNQIGKVPVARVLSNDTVIFEQGLGGKGDRGPVGTVANLPPATTLVIGGCTLLTASSDANQAFVISDTDSRLADSRNPLPHTHQAGDVTFIPGFGISANNIQTALQEVSVEKLDKAGGTMSGALTLNSNPTTTLHAATKQYVDNLVSGLIWLDPVELINLISDNVATPPLAPNNGDAYIIPAGATGSWSVIAGGNVVSWDEDLVQWIDHGPVGSFHAAEESRFAIAMLTSTVPSGSFTGQKNNIASYNTSGSLTGFVVPVNNNAIYVHYEGSNNAFNQYAYNGTDWVLFSSGQNLSPDGTTIDITSNIISVVPWSSGGEIDAKFWQGLEPTDLATIYAAFSHTHPSTSITVAPYNTALNWGTLANTSDEIVAIQNQLALQDITANKAAKMPTYASLAHRPTAANVDGMFCYVQGINRAYVASNGAWVPMVKENDTINLPYDLAFHIAGGMQTDRLVGSFVMTRTVTIKSGAPGAVAFADTTASDGSYILQLIHRPYPTYTPAVVGTITFSVGTTLGVFAWASDVSFVANDLLQIRTPLGVPDSTLEDLTITLVGCAPTVQCVI